MMRALYSAAAGMISQEFNINVISNNLANVNTTGFKQSRAEFQDLLYQNMRQAGGLSGQGMSIPSSLQIGGGSRPIATTASFTSGPLQITDNPYDIAIEGSGFFKVLMPDGSSAYTRDGSFKTDIQGRLVTADGYPLEPEIVIPSDAVPDSLVIGNDGTVSIRRNGSDGLEDLGTNITLTRFINPGGLNNIGKNLFVSTSASGEAIEGNPGSDGIGTLAQKALEGSNVQLVEEMVNMIMAQRAYETNAKAIQASDDMLGVANTIKR